jgi:prevent-host-death family protein
MVAFGSLGGKALRATLIACAVYLLVPRFERCLAVDHSVYQAYSTGQINWSELKMREVQASEAKTHLLGLLDAVERGETIVITRHGRPIARIVPESDHRRAELKRVFAEIEELRKTMPRISVKELLEARHEGHKR